MKFTAAIGALLYAAHLGSAASCKADNCARAVTGTGRGRSPTAQYADCKSYQACTVTPAPTYVTETSTYTLEPDTIYITQAPVTTLSTASSDSAKKVRRQEGGWDGEGGDWGTDPVTRCGYTIPSYASACDGPVRYSSACSCFGVTRTVVSTAATPTRTMYEEVYVTPSPVTVTVAPEPTDPIPPPPNNGGGILGLFHLQIRGSEYEGKYVFPDETGNLVPANKSTFDPESYQSYFSLMEHGEARSFGDMTNPWFNNFTFYQDTYYGSPVLHGVHQNVDKNFRCHVGRDSYLHCDNTDPGNMGSYWNLTSFRFCEYPRPRLWIVRKDNPTPQCWSASEVWLKVEWKDLQN